MLAKYFEKDNKIKIKNSKEIYQIYKGEIIEECITLQKVYLNFIIQVYGLYTLVVIFLDWLSNYKMDIGSYVGIIEIVFAFLSLLTVRLWIPTHKKFITVLSFVNITQFLIFAYMQYAFLDVNTGFLVVLFSIVISSIVVIRQNVFYFVMVSLLLIIDVLHTLLFTDFEWIFVWMQIIENAFICYCAIFINIYFTRMKLKEIVTNVTLTTQRDTDSLTGLLNRRASEKYINKFFNGAYLQALIILDIDNFKAVNDTFGHTTGDQVLKDIATTIQSIFRADDCVSRLGGDEFLIFMPHIDSQNIATNKAMQLIDTLTRTVVSNDKKVEISCSIGITYLFGNDKYDFEETYKRADDALYESKRKGKGQFSIWGN